LNELFLIRLFGRKRFGQGVRRERVLPSLSTLLERAQVCLSTPIQTQTAIMSLFRSIETTSLSPRPRAQSSTSTLTKALRARLNTLQFGRVAMSKTHSLSFFPVSHNQDSRFCSEAGGVHFRRVLLSRSYLSSKPLLLSISSSAFVGFYLLLSSFSQTGSHGPTLVRWHI
jgi:hypothetical protein